MLCHFVWGEYSKPAVSVFMFGLDVVEIYECSLQFLPSLQLDGPVHCWQARNLGRSDQRRLSSSNNY